MPRHAGVRWRLVASEPSGVRGLSTARMFHVKRKLEVVTRHRGTRVSLDRHTRACNLQGTRPDPPPPTREPRRPFWRRGSVPSAESDEAPPIEGVPSSMTSVRDHEDVPTPAEEPSD